MVMMMVTILDSLFVAAALVAVVVGVLGKD